MTRLTQREVRRRLRLRHEHAKAAVGLQASGMHTLAQRRWREVAILDAEIAEAVAAWRG